MRQVMLPIDGSTRSLRSVAVAKQIFSPQDTEITLVNVVGAPIHNASLRGFQSSEDSAIPDAQHSYSQLEDIAKLLPGFSVSSKILLGENPGAELVLYAKNNHIDTILMTRSSRGPLRKLGSVATHIVRNANFLNVLVLRENDEA